MIVGEGVRWNALRAGSVNLKLGGVDLLQKTASTADGRFDEVELPGVEGEPALAAVTIEGPAERARTTIEIDAATVNRIARAAFQSKLGTAIDAAELVAPDRILIRRGDVALTGTLQVEADGALVVATTLGTVRLVEPDPSMPVRLTAVSATPAALELSGTIDLQSLLR